MYKPKVYLQLWEESTSQFFLHCYFNIPIRNDLFDKLKEILTNLQGLSDQNITEILLYSSPHFNDIILRIILKFAINYIMDSKRSIGFLF